MLVLNNVTKIFNLDQPEQEHKIALKNCSLKIEEGEFVTIIGGNGSGKTTLLNVIAGVYEPTYGSIQIDETNITNMKEYKRARFFGRVFQDPLMGTAANMSIEENLSIASRRGRKNTLRWGFNKKEASRYKELLRLLGLGLETQLNGRMGKLSGGQRQAVTLLMATLQKPRLLLLDEHTAALDPKTAKTVLKITNELVLREKITTIMITHNMRDAIKYGDRLLMFHQGEVILDIGGEAKKNLAIETLLNMFEANTDIEVNDTMLLTK